MIGRTLGAYHVLVKLGEGGMGEVYRARDSRLQREVAIKVLPEALSVDGDTLARFGREAQVLAQLNHPNIAAVYGVEDAAGVRALVMELVEGPTLAEVIDASSGRGMPVADVVEVGRQIASALEAAHEQGIIHRDVKPANVKLRPDGTVKVLDFGLAKAFEPVSPAASAAVFNSPTLSVRATQAGLVLGTAAYMSPEQAKGKPVDRRADIWAFGVVMFEMLCGRSMYTGETVSEVLARVIEREPDLTGLPARTPRRLRELLRRCLVKDPRNRLRDIGEARVALEEIGARPDEPADPSSAPLLVPPPTAAWRRALPWTIAAAALVLAGLVGWAPWRGPAAAPPPIRVTADLGIVGSLATLTPLALSPDGSTLAVAGAGATSGDQGLIHVRRMDQHDATPLAGTAGARSPFFSPNGEWIAFFADRKLKKISVNGGAAVTLCDAPLDRGGSWGADGTIVFAASNRTGLSRVRAEGGTPEPFSTLDAARGEVTHRLPHFIPGSDAILYMTHTAGNNFDDSDIVIQRLSDGVRQTVHRGGMHPMYFRSGHLAFVKGGTLFVAPFDARSLKVTGTAFPVLESVRSNTTSGFSWLAAAANGTIVYVRDNVDGRAVVLNSVGPGGQPQPLRSAALNADALAIAPDGQRAALEIFNGADVDVWIYEPARDVLTRLTSETVDEEKPVWTPDGSRVTYSVAGAKDGKYGIDWRRADSGGDAQRLIESHIRMYPASWHPGGRLLAYVEQDGASGGNIKILSLVGDAAAGWKPGTTTTFLGTPFQEHGPAFSPDGKWLAYASNQSGRYEVYVRPFPGSGAQVQISTTGGLLPRWSPKASELYFVNSEREPMVVSYRVSGTTLRPDKPRVWADVRIATRGANQPYDLYPDGKRMMYMQDPGANNRGVDRLTFLFNGFEEIRRKAPAK